MRALQPEAAEELIVWSDEKTEHQGSIEASGKNGFIEVSCKDLLVCSGENDR